MKSKKPFKIGATYQLKSRDNFEYTPYIIEQYGEGEITFTVAGIDMCGHARDGQGRLVACCRERHMFKRIDNK